MRRRLPQLLAFLLALVPAALAAQTPDTALRRILAERTAEGGNTGIVVGLLEPDGSTRFFTAGRSGHAWALDQQSLFEIGSITKVFTGVLLADMVRRGEVSLDDPIAKYLPREVKVPARNGKQITLGDLARQNSGLPRLPGNLRPANAANPYADYTVAQLYEFLGSYTPLRDPGAQYEYSNLGVGLLGHVLALRAGKSYEELVRERILQPLGMQHSGITLTPWMREHMTRGHGASGDTVSYWDLPTLAGAGAIRSNAADMLKFLAAVIGGSTPLHESFRLATSPQAAVGGGAMIGLLWMRTPTAGDTIIWHNGGTAGFRSFAGVRGRRGVVVLTNGGPGADDLGFHLLDPTLALAAAPRPAIEVAPAVLARYVGTYQVAPGMQFTITQRNSGLYAQLTGQQALRIWPASETEFFYREVAATIHFQIGAAGEVTGLVLHQNGRQLPAQKIK